MTTRTIDGSKALERPPGSSRTSTAQELWRVTGRPSRRPWSAPRSDGETARSAARRFSSWSLRPPAESLRSAPRISRLMRSARRSRGLQRRDRRGVPLASPAPAGCPPSAGHNDHYVPSAGRLRSAICAARDVALSARGPNGAERLPPTPSRSGSHRVAGADAEREHRRHMTTRAPATPCSIGPSPTASGGKHGREHRRFAAEHGSPPALTKRDYRLRGTPRSRAGLGGARRRAAARPEPASRF